MHVWVRVTNALCQEANGIQEKKRKQYTFSHNGDPGRGANLVHLKFNPTLGLLCAAKISRIEVQVL